MYHLRLKIFIFLCIGGLIVTVGRLMVLQTIGVGQARQEISDMRILPAEQRPTIRGTILDRRERPVALDEPAFFLQITYDLTRYRDRRWQEGKILRAIREDKPRSDVEAELAEDWKPSFKQLDEVIDLANTLADASKEDILMEIDQINDRLWEMARRIWWRRRNREKSWDAYFAERDSIGPEKVITVDLYEMHKSYPLIELKTEEDLMRAQRALVHLEGLTIEPQAKRSYPFGSAASQLLGWVGPVNENEMGLFENDEYMRYLSGEMLGKFGIERIYEPVLRGRRGEVIYDREGTLLEKKEPQFGRDVQLTIDIELQAQIEALLADTTMPHKGKISAAVVLDAARNDILAMASIPTFDLNRIRQYDYYTQVFNDPNTPMMHRALEKNYPPGSTAKPIILAAGLQERKITPHEVIHCGYEPPPGSWPKCIAQWKFHNPHDNKWDNNGRNAIRGSCNIYFSRLADRLNSNDLQKWFFYFGYGQNVLLTSYPDDLFEEARRLSFKQSCGSIIYGLQTRGYTDVSEIEPFPPDGMSDKRYWGIGQGNLRVTVLQVANGLSVMARNGVYKAPRLIFDEQDPLNDRHRRQLPLSASSIAAVRDGMHAVVYEDGGTAHTEFKGSDLLNRKMTLYGKTGSTENPEHAWFECLAEDTSGRAVVIVALVEGGLSGSGEAVPLGKEILRLCNEAGYIGTRPTVAQPAD